MAEWVQKGNLKGPQGDPGQDAQLPAGGTEGQVLTKTSGGEAWEDAPQPDMTGVVKYDGATFSTSESVDFINSVLFMDNDAIDQISIEALGNGADLVASSEKSATIRVQDAEANHEVLFRATPSSSSFSIDSKSVTSITDAISDSPAGNALVTDKAVADYVSANAPSVTLPLPVSQGGTGATTAEGARTALGIPDIEVATDEEFDSYMGLS